MKNALLTLLFLGGIAVAQADAQVCCQPGCCSLFGKKDKTTAVKQETSKSETATATCTPAELEACKKAGVTCSPKQKKGAAAAAAAAANEPVKKAGDNKKSLDNQPVAKQVALREE